MLLDLGTYGVLEWLDPVLMCYMVYLYVYITPNQDFAFTTFCSQALDIMLLPLASFCLGRQWICALVIIPWSGCNGNCGCRAQFSSGRFSCRSGTHVSFKVFDAALTRLRCLFISCCSFSFCSILTASDFVVNLHTFRSAVKASRSVGATSPALRSRLQTSLYRGVGLPAGLGPVASSSYSISFGIPPSSMRAAWPSHRSLLFASMLIMMEIPARLRNSSLVMCCCQEIPRIRLMHRRWKLCSLCSCLE